MTLRDTNLQQLLDLSQRIIEGSGDARATAAGARAFDRLQAHEGSSGAVTAARLPVCHPAVDAALAGLATEASPLPELGAAFTGLEGRLAWVRRRNAEAVGEPFFSGHANAMLVGPGGLEQRDDVWVGVTAMAPGIVYPDHDHPPEEVYIALSPGEWWNADMDWTEPGPGGVIYNPRGILHAMRAHDRPLLALWFLPID